MMDLGVYGGRRSTVPGRSGEAVMGLFWGLYGGSHSKTSDKNLSILFAIVCLHTYNIVLRANPVHSRVSRLANQVQRCNALSPGGCLRLRSLRPCNRRKRFCILRRAFSTTTRTTATLSHFAFVNPLCTIRRIWPSRCLRTSASWGTAFLSWERLRQTV